MFELVKTAETNNFKKYSKNIYNWLLLKITENELILLKNWLN